MIIVSQDEKHIVNFEKIKEIRINSYNCLMADIYSDYELRLGNYKTEERAKEILQEIVSEYKKYATISNISGNDIRGIYDIPKVYKIQRSSL